MATSPICLTTRPPYRAKLVFQTRLSGGGAAEKIVVVGSRECRSFSAGGAVLGLRLGREWLKDVAVPIRPEERLTQVRAAGL
jgi:hypothetical protein